MRIKKIILAGLLGVNLSLVTISGLNKNVVYAQSTEVVYKAFTEKTDFNGGYFNFQWGLDNDGSFKYSEQVRGKLVKQPLTQVEAVNDVDIDFPEVRAKFSGGRQETIVAVIDTGVDYNHEDLQNVLWVNKGEIPDNGIDDDGNGYIDDVNGWNFYDDNNILYNGKEDSHGTHIAGTIIANINSKGISGVAGSSNVKIMILKALGGADESGFTYGIVNAIEYAERMGATICNFSFGTETTDKYMEEAIRDSKMLFVVASGNGDTNNGLGYNIDTKPVYPASYGYDNIISVANLQADGKLHISSNYSPNSVDIAAPGSKILSTIDSETFNANYVSGRMPTPYAYMVGTSMAAPFVAGTAALVYSDFPGITIRQVKESILEGVKRFPELTDKVSTGGMLSADGAYSYVYNNYQNFLITNKKLEEAKKAEETKKAENVRKAEEAKKLEEAKKAEEQKNNQKKADKKKISKNSVPSIKIYYTKNGKILVRVNDEDDDISLVRYAVGRKNDSYFSDGKKGYKINLNFKSEKILTLKKGRYTFYVMDKKGNKIIKRVVIK